MERLRAAASLQEELQVLADLQLQLGGAAGTTAATAWESDGSTSAWRQPALAAALLPAPSHESGARSVVEVLGPDLAAFTLYLFSRRFERTERQEAIVGLHATGNGPRLSLPAAGGPSGGSGDGGGSGRGEADAAAADPSTAGLENERRLHLSLSWLLLCYGRQPFSTQLLQALAHTVAHSKEAPVVRKNANGHVLDWLSECSVPTDSSDSFSCVIDVVCLGLTDVWSAIRKNCAARLASLLRNLIHDQVQLLFSRLSKICQDDAATWQQTHGALQGITSVIRMYCWTAKASSQDGQVGGSAWQTPSSTESIADRTEFVLMFGDEPLPHGLPATVRSRLTEAVFRLLAHKQLSVREQATKALSALLSRSQFKEALSTLSEVVRRLRGDDALPNRRPRFETFRFLDAYEAEGLLGVCIFIIKHIESGFLLPHWPMYFATFDMYLMHPASTVRQATSTIFKLMVAKDSSNPIMLKLVLQGLAADWGRDATHLCGKPDKAAALKKAPARCPSVGNLPETGGDPSLTWEWLEGRLLAYELILKFLLTNHIHYLFPPTMLSGPYAPGKASRPRHVVKRRLDMPGDLDPPSPASTSSTAWDGNRSFDALRQPTPQFARPTVRKNSSMPVLPIRATSNRPAASQQPVAPVERSWRRQSTKSLSPVNSTSSLQSFASHEDQVARPEPVHATAAAPLSTSPAELPATPPRRGLARRMSARSITLHQHIIKIDDVKPDQPFRPGRSSRTFEQPPLKRRTQTLSLLSHCQAMDLRGANPADLRLSSSHKMPSPLPDDVLVAAVSPKSPRKHHLDARGTTPPSTRKQLPSPNWIGGAKAPAWVDTSRLVPLSNVLWTMLVQTAEATGSSRFELKRIGKMVMPLLVEALRWYDYATLQRFWTVALPCAGGWMSAVAAMSIRNTLNHAAWLVEFFNSPPDGWKHPEACRTASMQLVNATRDATPAFLAAILRVVESRVWNHFSVCSLEILMVLATFFQDCIPTERDVESIVVMQLLSLYRHAEPRWGGAERLLALSATEMPPLGEIPVAGVLSCVGRSPMAKDPRHRAQCVVRLLFDTVAWVIPAFLDVCDLGVAMDMLPVILHRACTLTAESNDANAKLYFEGIHRILDRTGYAYWFQKEREHEAEGRGVHCRTPSAADPPKQLEERVVAVCDTTCAMLLGEFANENTDAAAVRRILDVIRTIFVIDSDTRHLGAVLSAIAKRVRAASAVVPLAVVPGPLAETLQLLSGNEPATEPALDSDSEGDEDVGSSAKALNLSNGHLSIASGDSDWDSWEDDEPSDETTLQLLLESLEQFRAVFDSDIVRSHQQLRSGAGPAAAVSAAARPAAFEQALTALSQSDETAIRWLMDKFSAE